MILQELAQLFTHPPYIDIERRARFLRSSALGIILLSLINLPFIIYFGYIAPPPGIPSVKWALWAITLGMGICIITIFLSQRRQITLGVILIITYTTAITVYGSRPIGIINTPGGAMFGVHIIIAGFVGGTGIAIIYLGLVILYFIFIPIFIDTTAMWTPYTIVNLAVVVLSFVMLTITQRFIQQLHISNQQLRETNEREQRARAFIGFFQHELKSYTTALEGLIEIFKPSITATIDERSALVLNELDLGIERLNNLARQLMVLSREGIVPYQMHDIPLAPLFRQAKADIEAASMRYHLPLVVEMHVADDLQVCGDSQYLALAIGTALRNALEALAHQPRQQEAIQISLSAHRQGQRVVIRVEDSGPGFPAPILEALEEATGQRALPLFGWSTKSTGTGLGLPLILHVAHLHAGRARFRNTTTGACVEFDVAGGSTTGMTPLMSATNH